MSGNRLADAFPALARALPYLALAELPTPLEDAPAVAAHLGIGSLAIKRDDLTSPHYGGNKVRKLDYLLADALARGCDRVLTYGSVGSNHALATAVLASRLGMTCDAVFVHQPLTPYVGPTVRYHLKLGTRLHVAASFNQAGEILERVRAEHAGGAARVYEIPWGGSNWLGTVGFVAAALELARQAGPAMPDFIYTAGGTMGTVIGLALGLRIAGAPTRIVAPRVVPTGASSPERVAALVGEFNREIHARDPAFPLFDEPLANIELRTEFLGDGYAEPTAAGREAVALLRELAHLKLETTYTGKAMAGLVADARLGRLRGRRVVFWNTYSCAPYPEGLDEVPTAGLPAALRPYLDAIAA